MIRIRHIPTGDYLYFGKSYTWRKSPGMATSFDSEEEVAEALNVITEAEQCTVVFYDTVEVYSQPSEIFLKWRKKDA